MSDVKSKTAIYMPSLPWRCERRGYHTATKADGTRLYVSRTRDGWEYGTVVADAHVRIEETSRPLATAQRWAEEQS